MAETRITDGTSQQDRMMPALAAGYIHVDEMRFADLLAMAADYARMLTFYGANNEPDGDWEFLFTSDDAIIMAMILTTELETIEAVFATEIDRHVSQFGDEYDVQTLPNYALAQKIDFWFNRLRTIESAASRNLEEKIEDSIQEKLGKELQRLGRFLRQYAPTLEETFAQDFSSLWFDIDAEDISRYPVPAPSDAIGNIERFLKSNFYVFYHAIALLQESSANLLLDSMKSENHNPAVGLYIAFITLFQRAQHKLNLFTQRHLHFYYHDVLKARPRPLVPDSTYLLFRPDSEDRKILIPEGTEFLAGLDENNQEVMYTADNDLLVHNAEVRSLSTLYFVRDRLSEPENTLKYITGAKVNQIPLVASDVAVGTELPAWPVVGAPKNDAEQRQYEDASLGFAVASPVLFLEEGERDMHVTLHIESAAPEQKPLHDFLEDILAELTITGAEKQHFFFKAFRHIFTISLTTAHGWFEVQEYLPLSHIVDEACAKDCLKIYIRLPPEADPIVSYAPDVHGQQYDTQLPVIRFMVNPTSYLYPYSLLKRLLITAIDIEVEVKGAREVLVYNNFGQLDANSPFYPFGPVPAVGSYFIVGHAEAARKQITRFEVDVEWGDLPAEPGGFAQYYQAYNMPFDNAVFEARVTALKDGRWQPAAEQDQPQVTLFQSEERDNEEGGRRRIHKKRLLSCDDVVTHLKPLEGTPTESGFGYNTRAKDGFVKFTLTHPPYAFGHKDYPLILTRVFTANARLKKLRYARPVPNAPYTPLVNAIAIHYRAVSTIDLDQTTAAPDAVYTEKIFHLHPFGLESLSSATHRNIAMLPQYDAAGYLLIGLSARELSGRLTLFFHLCDDSAPGASAQPSRLQWSYLTSNRWKLLEKSQVISDTTNGFLFSGIVTLTIPADINRDNTILPGHLFWLSVSVDHHPEGLCSAYAVHTQALKVSWQPRSNVLAHLQRRLAAGTIKEPRISLPGIDSIVQIVDAFGGKSPESSDQVKRRFSERLKHKNRAITPWDYERLILEHFPEIVKVKCFAHMVDAPEPHKCSHPGAILIVVIPAQKDQASVTLQPRANGLLLRDIEACVRKLASPFARIKIRNPVYERIQIRCTVKFSQGAADGYYVNALNQAITDYLSPWSQTGYRAQFGWRIRRYDLESYIRNLDYIDFVTNFSMLHIVDDRRIEQNGVSHFRLFDTAKEPEALAVFSPDSRWLVTTSADHTVRLWDVRAAPAAATPHVLYGHQDIVVAVAFSPDSRWLVTASADHTVRLWDVRPEVPLVPPQVLLGHEDTVVAVAFSPDSRWLVTASADHTVRLWDVRPEVPLGSPQVLLGHEDTVVAVAFSPDSRWLVTTSADHTVRLWDVGAATPSDTAVELLANGYAIVAVAFSPDSRWLITASADHTVRLWNVRAAPTAAMPALRLEHASAIVAVAISPDSRWLVTTSTDRTARLWDVSPEVSSEAPRMLRGHASVIVAVAFSPDSRWLVTTDARQSAWLWDMSLEPPSETAVVLRGPADRDVEEIGPLFPWSIAIPARHHFIETIDTAVPIRPEITGIDELAIGSTFIISGK